MLGCPFKFTDKGASKYLPGCDFRFTDKGASKYRVNIPARFTDKGASKYKINPKDTLNAIDNSVEFPMLNNLLFRFINFMRGGCF